MGKALVALLHSPFMNAVASRALLLVLVALAGGLALTLALGVSLGGAATTEAADPTLEFEMEVKGGTPAGGGGCTTVGTAPTEKGDASCIVAGGSSFTVGVGLADPGALTGQVSEWQAVIGWTAGLTGPGDPASTKTYGFRTGNDCPDEEALAAPFLDVAQTAAIACAAFPPPFTDIEATDMIADFELTCGASSQEQVTMIVELLTGDAQSGTALFTAAPGVATDKDGSETITVLCGGPLPVGGIAELPDVAGTPVQRETGGGGPLGGALAALAAGAVTLAVAGWYARRRRLTR